VLEDLPGTLGTLHMSGNPKLRIEHRRAGQGRKITADRPDRDRQESTVTQSLSEKDSALATWRSKRKKNSAHKIKYEKRISPARSGGEDKNQGGKDQNSLGGLNLANAQDSAQPQMPRSKTKITAHKKT
jgi:hypothetical protein